jgi:hypothetical protein
MKKKRIFFSKIKTILQKERFCNKSMRTKSNMVLEAIHTCWKPFLMIFGNGFKKGPTQIN